MYKSDYKKDNIADIATRLIKIAYHEYSVVKQLIGTEAASLMSSNIIIAREDYPRLDSKINSLDRFEMVALATLIKYMTSSGALIVTLYKTNGSEYYLHVRRRGK